MIEAIALSKAGYRIQNEDAIAAINTQKLAEKYGAIILTDFIDYEVVERIILVEGIMLEKG